MKSASAPRRGEVHHLLGAASHAMLVAHIALTCSARAAEVPFDGPIVVAPSFFYALSVLAADVDGDGDNDILSLTYNTPDDLESQISWYRNLDGHGAFSAPVTITTGLSLNPPDRPSTEDDILTADLDGDGDLDVFYAAPGDNRIAWCPNENGRGQFGSPRIVVDLVEKVVDVHAGDLDGDDDIDVLAACYGDHVTSRLVWFENDDGVGGFGPERLIAGGLNSVDSVFAADFDADGDLDVLSSDYSKGKIAWYPNTNGRGIFGTEAVGYDGLTSI